MRALVRTLGHGSQAASYMLGGLVLATALAVVLVGDY